MDAARHTDARHFHAPSTDRHETEVAVQSSLRDRSQNALLGVVGMMSSILSAPDQIGGPLYGKCLHYLAQMGEVQQICVWKTQLHEEEILCRQLYRWDDAAARPSDESATVSVTLPAGWHAGLAGDTCINLRTKDMPSLARQWFSRQSILSTLLTPVIISGELWGVVEYDDQRRERIFSLEEQDLLQYAGTLAGSVLLHNENMRVLRLENEKALTAAEEKSQFLSSMSHEIRSPLNAIIGMGTIAEKMTSLEEMLTCVQKINRASHHLLGIVNNVLDMSKINAGKFTLMRETVILAELVDNVKNIVGEQSRRKNQTFAIGLAEDLPRAIVGDKLRLSQVIINLLSNAVKFTPEGGAIGLDVSTLDMPGHACGILFTVMDSGIGIAPEDIDRLFDAFEQLDPSVPQQYGGTGLGLAITKQIVDMMSGHICVESMKDQWSRFKISLPVELPLDEPEKIPTETAEPQYDFSGKTLLLVDDMEINREIVCQMLKETGIAMEFAENGQEAVQLYAKAPQKYDIVFMDIHMPVLDGLEATRMIRDMEQVRGAHVPILAMTASALPEDILTCKEAGMDGHISKPIDLPELLEKTQFYLDAGRQPGTK